SGVFSVAFSPDGERVVASSWDCSFTVWDVEQGAELFTQGQHYNTGLCICEKYENPECPISAHGQAITSICFSPDGKRVVSASNDGTVKIWDAKTCAK
ncbi:quinon protein alcohol dehydrogenase-like superfamily, partial [Baffinella frigidus]